MALPATMSGVLLTRHGGPEALVWSEAIPLPQPGPGETLVRVLASSVNNTDINTRLGWYAPEVTGATAEGTVATEGGWAGALAFPRIQGGDLCGRVVAHGPGVAAPPIGARVTCPINQPEPTADNPRAIRVPGSDYDGFFAQFACVPARHLRDVTASPLSDPEIAAMPCAHGTALGLLTRAGVGAGQSVLVTGASGGVGLAAVQIATHLGARVTAIAAPAKAGAVRAMGAATVLPRDAALPPRAFDAVIDVVGGPGFGGLIAALRPGGHLATAGAIAGPIATLDLRQLYLNDITLHGCTHQPPAVFDRLAGWIVAGILRPLVARLYPLSDIARAQADFLAKSSAGKLVLIPPEPAT
jgi:NADPH:quinone reductase-like Zn-dependent oxidoreductase